MRKAGYVVCKQLQVFTDSYPEKEENSDARKSHGCVARSDLLDVLENPDPRVEKASTGELGKKGDK